jgi:DNA-binding transcriptional LysR family regulator
MTPKELPNLETFAEAAERGSFTATARQLRISQAAVSQRIQQLEMLLGVPLFRREGGHVVLTEAGKQLHTYARRILELTAEACQAVTGAKGEVTGELLLAASSVPGEHFLPTALATFRQQHPAVQVRVSVLDTEAVFHELEQGHAHIGLVGGQGGNANLEFRRFAHDELVVVVPRGHPWWGKTRISASELAAQPLIHRERGSGSRRCLERSLERLGISPSSLNVVLELGSNEAIKEAVMAGLGVAVLSRWVVLKEIDAGQLHALRVSKLSLDRDIFVVRDRRRALPAPATLFMHLLKPEPPTRT